MGTGRAGRDAHAGRDQPGVLAVGDPDQDLDLSRREHLEQGRALVVGLGDGVEEFTERALQQLRGDRRLARPGLHDGALDALYALVVTYIPGSARGEGGGDAARA